jgi:hypothetical protein
VDPTLCTRSCVPKGILPTHLSQDMLLTINKSPLAPEFEKIRMETQRCAKDDLSLKECNLSTLKAAAILSSSVKSMNHKNVDYPV